MFGFLIGLLPFVNRLTKEITGSQRIARAVGRFKIILDEIETGISHNLQRIAHHEQQSVSHTDQAVQLKTDNANGERVAAKLREFVS